MSHICHHTPVGECVDCFHARHGFPSYAEAQKTLSDMSSVSEAAYTSVLSAIGQYRDNKRFRRGKRGDENNRE